MQNIIQISTQRHNGFYDITRQVKDSVRKSGITNGMVSVYAQGATAAIMIGFNMIGPLFANIRERLKSKSAVFIFLAGRTCVTMVISNG